MNGAHDRQDIPFGFYRWFFAAVLAVIVIGNVALIVVDGGRSIGPWLGVTSMMVLLVAIVRDWRSEVRRHRADTRS